MENFDFVTSDNGSICLLVQFLAGPNVEPLTGLHCSIVYVTTLLGPHQVLTINYIAAIG